MTVVRVYRLFHHYQVVINDVCQVTGVSVTEMSRFIIACSELLLWTVCI